MNEMTNIKQLILSKHSHLYNARVEKNSQFVSFGDNNNYGAKA
jgi:hypothetical protein